MIILFFLRSALAVHSRLFRVPYIKEDVHQIALLFLRPFGIGDVIMLSPILVALHEIFPDATITVFTWFPRIFDLPYIDWRIIKDNDNVRLKESFDLVLFPSLALSQIRYLSLAPGFAGYIAGTILQSNLNVKTYTYDPQNEHYLWRGVRLIQALDDTVGRRLEKAIRAKNVVYPPLICTSSPIHTELKGKKYAIVSLASKWPDRQWPRELWVPILRNLITTYKVDVLVCTGSTAPREQAFINILTEELNLPPQSVYNAAKNSTLTELFDLIQHAELFIGLDSGPSHAAYFLAKRVVVLFFIVDPEFRLPLTSLSGTVKALYPNPSPPRSLYSGWGPVPQKIIASYIARISPRDVQAAIQEVFVL